MSALHQITASALVLRPDRRILLLRHKALKVWLYPGGHVEDNETPDDAALREVLEETGFEAEHVGSADDLLSDPVADVATLRTPYCVLRERIGPSPSHHYHVDLVYSMRVGRSIGRGEALDDLGFFSCEETAGLSVFPNFRKLLTKVFADGDLWQRIG